MNPVLTNPYRILGLQATATRRELTRRIEDLTAWLEFGKTKSYPLDFSDLFPLVRTSQTVENAVHQLDNDELKLLHAFFWFIKDDSVDELALECIENSHFDKAGELWRNQILKSDAPLFSWLINYSTLSFLACFQNNDFENNIKIALQTAGYLIKYKQDELAEKIFKTTVAQFDKVAVSKKFTDTILEFVVSELSSRNLENKVSLLSLFDSFPDEAKQHLLQGLTTQPIKSIEQAIAYSSNLRNDHDDSEIAHCNSLLNYNSAIEQLLPYTSNYRVKAVLNDFANEVLECSIYANNVLDDTELAMTLLDEALILPSWDATAVRIADSRQRLIEIQTEKREQTQCAAIIEYAELPIKTLTHAKIVINVQLQELKKLDVAPPTFLMVSSICANNILNYLIDLFNNEISSFEKQKNGNMSKLDKLITLTGDIAELGKMLYQFDLDAQTMSRLDRNMDAFTRTHQQMNELQVTVHRERERAREKERKAKTGKYIFWGIALFILFALFSR